MAGNRGDRRVRTVREKEKRLKKNRNESRSSSEGTRGRVRRQMHRRRVASRRPEITAVRRGKCARRLFVWTEGSCGNVRKRRRTSNVTPSLSREFAAFVEASYLDSSTAKSYDAASLCTLCSFRCIALVGRVSIERAKLCNSDIYISLHLDVYSCLYSRLRSYL